MAGLENEMSAVVDPLDSSVCLSICLSASKPWHFHSLSLSCGISVFSPSGDATYCDLLLICVLNLFHLSSFSSGHYISLILYLPFPSSLSASPSLFSCTSVCLFMVSPYRHICVWSYCLICTRPMALQDCWWSLRVLHTVLLFISSLPVPIPPFLSSLFCTLSSTCSRL